VAVPLVDDGPALVDDLLALLGCLLGVPVVGDQGQSEVLGEASCDPVLLDVGAEEVDAGEEGLAIFVASNNKVVVEGVGLVPLLVAEGSKVVGVLVDGVIDTVIMQHTLSGQLLQLPGCLLEIRELPGGSDHETVVDLLVAVDSLVLWMRGCVLKSPP